MSSVSRWIICVLCSHALWAPGASASGAYPGHFEVYPAHAASIDAWFGSAADLDGDGRDELLTGWGEFSTGDSFVGIRRFGGTPWESSSQVVVPIEGSGGSIPLNVYAADLDHDGDRDLLVPLNDTLVILPALSTWVFGAPLRQHIPGIGYIAVSDFDGDGWHDLVVCRPLQRKVAIYRGTGPFTHVLDAEFDSRRSQYYPSIADLDGDLDDDVVLPADTASAVLLGDGAGGFVGSEVPHAWARLAGDLDGDGVQDLVTQSTSLLGNGDGTFQLASTFTTLANVLTADMNEDGRQDLVGIRSGSPFMLSVQLGVGDGSFGAATLHPYNRGGTVNLALGDFDGDGHADIVNPERFGRDGVMFGLGNGSFQAPRPWPILTTAQEVRSARLTGGPKRDLVVVGREALAMTTLRATGLAQWGSPDVIELPGTPGAFGPEIADLNGDGRDDVVLAYTDLAAVSYWLTDGSGQLGPRTDLPTPVINTREVAVGDVDADGDMDILYQPFGNVTPTPSIEWYRGDGSGAFTANGTLPPGPLGGAYGNMVIRDLDGDGLPEVTMHDPNHGVTILPSTAPGVFGTPVQLAPSGIPYVAQAVVVGRFGSDAHLDVALQNLSSAWLFRGLGGLAFAPAQPLPPAATFGAGAFTADLDVDGWDEIVSGTTVVRFQASGQVDGSVGYGIAASGGRVGDVLDADGNGFPDLVGSAPNELLLKILVNRSGPQVLDAPPPAPNRSSLLLRAVANPCRERFELQLGGASGPVQLALYDIHGRRLRETRVEGTTGGIVRADLGSTHGLAPGVYLAMARQEDSRATIRLTLLR